MKFIRERFKSFLPAFQGFHFLIKFEKNALIHLIATIVAISISLLLKISEFEWLFIILAIAMVWITELINTAIEKLTDLVQPEIDPNVKIIKDLAASAVLISAVFSIIVATIIFLPKIILILN
jgi:diacylglycerol kinase